MEYFNQRTSIYSPVKNKSKDDSRCDIYRDFHDVLCEEIMQRVVGAAWSLTKCQKQDISYVHGEKLSQFFKRKDKLFKYIKD